MAPHWKCGSGQPVAGSNPALSAIYARRENADACVDPVRALAYAHFVRALASSRVAFASAPSRRADADLDSAMNGDAALVRFGRSLTDIRVRALASSRVAFASAPSRRAGDTLDLAGISQLASLRKRDVRWRRSPVDSSVPC